MGKDLNDRLAPQPGLTPFSLLDTRRFGLTSGSGVNQKKELRRPLSDAPDEGTGHGLSYLSESAPTCPRRRKVLVNATQIQDRIADGRLV